MKKLLNTSFLGLKLWWFLIPLGIGLIFFLVGTTNDLAISKAIVDQNGFLGVFVEGWGMSLAFALGAIASSAVCAGALKFQKRGWKIFGIAIFTLGMVVMTYETGHYLLKEFGGNPWLRNMGTGGKILGYGIGLALMSLAAVPSFFAFRKANPYALIALGLLTIGLMGVEAGLLEVIKNIVLRPRYRWIAGYTYDAQGNYVLAPTERIELYRAWFESWQWFSKKNYADPANIVTFAADSDYIKSFPSGHTGFFSVMMLVPAFLRLYGNKALTNRLIQPLVYGVIVLAVCVVGFARVYVGAHWVSDVSMAMMIVSILSMVGLVAINKVLNKLSKQEQ